jgi:N-acetylmuramoyl-L-alanine amidase
MKHYKHLFIAIFAITILGTPWLVSVHKPSSMFVENLFSYVKVNYSAAFFQEGVTLAQLRDKYDQASAGREKVRIFIMPGHEPDAGGTQFGSLKERDMVVDLAKHLEGYLSNDPHFEVVVGRDKKAWNPKIESYFQNNWNEIINFVSTSKNEMIRLLSSGRLYKLEEGVVEHNDLPKNSALRLYGINKWNNENSTDIAIHIHFNDYRRSNTKVPGEYTGFSIYVPERQYSNATSTRVIADHLFKRLSRYNPVSNLPDEDVGIVQEQDLIAIGAYNTANSASMLIEYGYIYEPQYLDATARDITIKDQAFQTYLGIQDFFGGESQGVSYDTLTLPHTWKNDISTNNFDRKDVLALQSALILEGLYPPNDKTKNECPRTGKFAACTVSAVANFQNKYNIVGEKNIVGENTRKVLNNLYSSVIR